MDVVYSFVESIHVFLPVVAVVSCVLIIFCCGFRGSQQPPEDYLEKIKKLDERKKKPPSKTSKGSRTQGFVPSSPSSQAASSISTEAKLRQRGVDQIRRTASVEDEGLASGVPAGTWVEVQAPKKKRKEKQASPEFAAVSSANVQNVVPSVEISSSDEGSPTKSNAMSKQNESAAVSKKKKNQKKALGENEPLTKGSAAFKPSVQPQDDAPPSANNFEREIYLPSQVQTGHLAAKTPDETSSTTSQKSTSSTSASSNKTFEKVLHGREDSTLEEEEVESDEFILVTASHRSPTVSGGDFESPGDVTSSGGKKKSKKKAKKAAVDEERPTTVVLPAATADSGPLNASGHAQRSSDKVSYAGASSKVVPSSASTTPSNSSTRDHKAPDTFKAEMPFVDKKDVSAVAVKSASPAAGSPEGSDNEAAEDKEDEENHSEDDAVKRKKKKKKSKKNKSGEVGLGENNAAKASDQEDDEAPVEAAIEESLEQDGSKDNDGFEVAAQKKKRRARRDV